MVTVVGAGGIVFAFGLLDDIVHLHPAAKLGAQLVAAYLVLHSTISVEFVSNQTLAWAIGILWLVGLTNAFNLLDNMDGLAGSLGVVAAVVLRSLGRLRRSEPRHLHPRHGARARPARLHPLQPSAERARRACSWATPAAS